MSNPYLKGMGFRDFVGAVNMASRLGTCHCGGQLALGVRLTLLDFECLEFLTTLPDRGKE